MEDYDKWTIDELKTKSDEIERITDEAFDKALTELENVTSHGHSDCRFYREGNIIHARFSEEHNGNRICFYPITDDEPENICVDIFSSARIMSGQSNTIEQQIALQMDFLKKCCALTSDRECMSEIKRIVAELNVKLAADREINEKIIARQALEAMYSFRHYEIIKIDNEKIYVTITSGFSDYNPLDGLETQLNHTDIKQPARIFVDYMGRNGDARNRVVEIPYEDGMMKCSRSRVPGECEYDMSVFDEYISRHLEIIETSIHSSVKKSQLMNHYKNYNK